MEEPLAVDAAPIKKDSSEVKDTGLGEENFTGNLQEGEIKVVGEEEKKANDESISEVPQDKHGESDEDFSEPL